MTIESKSPSRRTGANKYGIAPTRWLKMTEKERHAVRCQASRKRIKSDKEGREDYAARQRASQQAYRARNREKVQAYNAEWWKANRDKQSAYRRAYAKRLHARTTIRLDPDRIYVLISKAVGAALPKHVRDDVIGSMCLAVLEGKLLIDQIAAQAKKYVTDYNRQHEIYRTVSLHKPTNSDGFTVGEMLGVY